MRFRVTALAWGVVLLWLVLWFELCSLVTARGDDAANQGAPQVRIS